MEHHYYNLILNYLRAHPHWGDLFIFSDIDIIFLKPILKLVLDHLGEHDFVVQQGWPRNGLCAGFFVMRGNERTLRLLRKASDLLIEEKFSEQIALQKALNVSADEISWAFLPIEFFSNGAYVLKHRHEQKPGRYETNSELILDHSIALFHANCCIGLENKYHFLQRVQEKFVQNSLDVERLPECRTQQYSSSPIEQIIVFSAPRTGSSLIFNVLKYFFENKNSISLDHRQYHPSRKVFKTHHTKYFDLCDKNTTLFIVPVRNPFDAALSHSRIGGGALLPDEERAQALINKQCDRFFYAKNKKKEGFNVIFLRYEHFENNIKYLLHQIENIFSISIDEIDKKNILFGYSKENIAQAIKSLTGFQEFLPLSGFHGNHLASGDFSPSEEFLFWLKHYSIQTEIFEDE
ncbi:MAG: glycosyltransferase family 77 protein [Silvanigrellaceae bacterium]|nr:glycosyltransferase family 77 protein [Silvanigrellaceae bacterium]